MTGKTSLTIDARPEPISLNPARTAIVVVDLQNGYASPGGYRDLAGRDISGAPRVIENTLLILAAGRASGLTVVFLQNGWDPELREAGGEGSPNWHKSNPLRLMRDRPELAGKILTRGSWDYALFTGIATNVCVESTLRDAYFREFFCLLIEDATQQAGPAFIQDATVYNVETFLGWVTGTADFCRALDTAEQGIS